MGGRRGANRRLGGRRAGWSRGLTLPAGVRSQRVRGWRVSCATRRRQAGDGYHCACWSKTYSGCAWARASQSGTASTGGSSQAGGPRAGLIRGGSAGSPMWLRIRCTGAASVMKATMRTVSATGWIAAVLVHRARVRSGSKLVGVRRAQRLSQPRLSQIRGANRLLAKHPTPSRLPCLAAVRLSETQPEGWGGRPLTANVRYRGCLVRSSLVYACTVTGCTGRRTTDPGQKRASRCSCFGYKWCSHFRDRVRDFV
jgi:hypothetical protein